MSLFDEITEFVLAVRQIFLNPVMMVLYSLWLIIAGREKKWIAELQRAAEEDRLNDKPDEHIQGIGLTVRFLLRAKVQPSACTDSQHLDKIFL